MMDFLIIKLSNVFKLIHNFNVPSRYGTQTPFTNLTFDWVCPDDLKNSIPLIGGDEANFTYHTESFKKKWICLTELI